MSTQAKPDQQQQQRSPRSRPGEPTWEVTEFYPRQGEWSESEYLALETNRLVEYKDGCLELLPLPSRLHQKIVQLLARLLWEYIRSAPDDLEVYVAPMRVKLRESAYREPDVFVEAGGSSREQLEHMTLAEHVKLAIEVISPSNRGHDEVTKRAEYAAAGIPEYWLVDPELPQIEVLVLDIETHEYRQAGVYGANELAKSTVLEGFTFEVPKLV